MASDAEQGPESVAWDRVGQFFADMAAVTQRVWDRNLTLWGSVSKSVREQKYSADAMANDAAKAMAIAIDNVDDVWTFLTRVPEREFVATALPTAFLFFQEGEAEGAHVLPEPVWIRVAAADLEGLPDQATIRLTGRRKGVQALEKCVRATRVADKGYKLEAGDVCDLVPGIYSGNVYTGAPRPRLLANLRVVVQGTEAEDDDDERRRY